MKIVFNKGDNYKFNASGLKTDLKKGSLINEGDTIFIASDGLALLKIPGHSHMKLDAGTELSVDQLPEYLDKSSEVVEPAILQQIKGAILIEMEKPSDSETLLLRSKSATLGVRGTKFLVAAEDDVTVLVNEGLVEIKNESGQADFMTQNESMVVENGRNFTARQKIENLKTINWDVTSKNNSNWREARKKFRENFRKKRQRWKSNNLRYESFKKRWQEKKARYQERIQKLMKNPEAKKKYEEIKKQKKLKRTERLKTMKGRSKKKSREKVQKEIRKIENRRSNRPDRNTIRELRRRRRKQQERLRKKETNSED